MFFSFPTERLTWFAFPFRSLRGIDAHQPDFYFNVIPHRFNRVAIVNPNHLEKTGGRCFKKVESKFQQSVKKFNTYLKSKDQNYSLDYPTRL